MNIAKGDVGIFNLTITASKDIDESEIILVIIARPEKAIEYEKDVEARETLKVIIIATDEPSSEEDVSTDYVWILLILIVTIIIVLLIAIILIKRRKRSEQELPQTDVNTIKPIPAPQLETTQAQTEALDTSAQSSTPQLPFTTNQDINTDSSTTENDVPKLPGTTTTITASEAQQMPEVQQLPQLPPGETVENSDKPVEITQDTKQIESIQPTTQASPTVIPETQATTLDEAENKNET
jgi:hypothetical protein